MKCPECGTNEGIKFFLRHQAEDENDSSNNANVITILCTKCGKNESYFLAECLDQIYPSWSESVFNQGMGNNDDMLFQMFSRMTGGNNSFANMGLPQDFEMNSENEIAEEE